MRFKLILTGSVFLLILCVFFCGCSVNADNDNQQIIPLDGRGGGIIAFASERGGGDHEIYCMNADGSGITQLTDTFHINRTTLSNKFIDATGMSIIDYLVKLRIKVASMLLRDTHLSIAEVAYRVGFNNSTYFLRTFKKYVDCTPSEYRKK